jgi:PKD domain-containing protein
VAIAPAISRRPLMGALLAALALLMLAGATPARAVPAAAAGQQIQVMPQILLGSQNWNGGSPKPIGQNPNPSLLGYSGGPVLHSTNTFAIYWDPTSTSYPSGYPQSTRMSLNEFLQDVGADSGRTSNLFAVDGQYTDATGRASYASTFRGSYTDFNPFPSAGCTDSNSSGNLCLTVAQLQTELQNLIARQGLPLGLSNAYVLMTPPSVVVCTDASGSNCSGGNGMSVNAGTQPGFCAYHAFVGSGTAPYGDTSPYAAIPFPGSQPKSCQADSQGVDSSQPWIQLPNEQKQQQPVEPNQNTVYPDYADVLIDNVAHELNGMMTDPLLNAWHDPIGQEAPDKCLAQALAGQPTSNGFDPWAWPELVGETGTAKPTLQNTPQGFLIIWGNLNNTLINSAPPYWLHGEWNNAEANCELSVELVPRFVSANPVNSGDLVGFDGTSTLSTLGVASYVWNFGDGTTSGPPSSSIPTMYHRYASPGTYQVTLSVTDGGGYTASATQPVAVLGTPAPPGAAAGSAAAAPSGPGTPASNHAAPAPPSVSESILSRSLAKVLKSGLAVRYAVNQTVAGHFQVLLDRRMANRLHIGGSSAPGFGSSARNGAVVIGYALLVASRAGRSDTSISLSKAAAKRLRHTRSLQMAVRVMVSNGSAHSATVTQLVSLGR